MDRTCRLCFIVENGVISFGGEESQKLNIANVLLKHFWFQTLHDDHLPKCICRTCWKHVQDFHNFYNSIEIIHNNLFPGKDSLQLKTTADKEIQRNTKVNGINFVNVRDIKSENMDLIDITDGCFNYDFDIDNNNDNVDHNYDGSIDSKLEVKLKIELDSNIDGNDENDQQRFGAIEDESAFKKVVEIVKRSTARTSKSKNNKDSPEKIKHNQSKTFTNENVSEIDHNKKSTNVNKLKILKKNNIVNNKTKGKCKGSFKTLDNKKIKKNIMECIVKLPKVENTNDDILQNADVHSNNEHYNDDEPNNSTLIKLEPNEISLAEQKRQKEDIQIREFYNLTCSMCPVTLSTISDIRMHYRTVHNLKNGSIICCNKRLSKRCRLLEHLNWHLNPNEFKCTVCHKVYNDKYGLRIHMHFHSKPEERQYRCDICNESFTVRYHLMKHFRDKHITRIIKEFRCPKCDKCFNKNSVLQSHIRGVHEFKYVHVCHICAKAYKSKSQCQIHVNSEHSNHVKPKLQCQMCGALLKNESSLKSHLRRTHFGVPIACNLCGKIAPHGNALRNHMLNAHGELKHKCNLCEKAFRTPIRLKEHIATHSGSSILYTCSYCPNTYNSSANMHSHRKKKHPEEWLAARLKRNALAVI